MENTAGLFLIQKVDKKMIHTLCFWALNDIPELGKYGFWRGIKPKTHIPKLRALFLFHIDAFLTDIQKIIEIKKNFALAKTKPRY